MIRNVIPFSRRGLTGQMTPGRVVNLVLTATSFAGFSSADVDTMMIGFLLRHIFDLVLSSSVLGLIPILYFSFRKWPQQKEAVGRATFS